MNLYGEYGNVVVLKKHLVDQGFDVVIDKKTVEEEIDFNDYDFIYCGSGTEKNQQLALKDLIKRKDNLKEALSKTVVLFTGNAMEMLGETIDENKALGFVPLKTVTTMNRYTGDVVVKNNEIGEVVGFINKCTKITQDSNISLFEYVFTDSNLKETEKEGYRVNNVFGTHLIGPVLVKNPNFMKLIVKLLALRSKPDFIYKDISYPFEEDSYSITLKALLERKQK